MPARLPVSEDEFAAVVAELRGILAGMLPVARAAALDRWTRPPRRLPPTVTRQPWARRRLTLPQAAAVTGLAEKSLLDYTRHADRARRRGAHTPRLMPPADMAGRWEAGALAIWRAATSEGRSRGGGSPRWPAHATYLPAVRDAAARHGGRISVSDLARELRIGRRLAAALLTETGLGPPTDQEILRVLRDLHSREGRAATRTEAEQALDAAGLHADRARIARLLLHARRDHQPTADVTDEHIATERATGHATPAGLESLRDDGLLTGGQLARAYGVTAQAVLFARRRGQLTPAMWEHGRPLYDPARVRERRDARPGPVDIDYDGDGDRDREASARRSSR